MHFRRAMLLVVTQNLARLKLNVARIPPALVPVNSHEPRLVARRESSRHFPIVNREIGIAIQNEKAIPQQRERAFQRPAGAEQVGTIEGILDPQTQRGAV